jgi:Flp pilus assembly protein CpaB
MQSHWRTLTLGVVVALAGVLGAEIVNLAAQATDPRIGTWKLNAAKSKYDPGPPPQSLTVKVEPAGQGEKVTAEFVNADGTRATTVYTANFDGKDSPLTGSQLANTVALKRTDARTTVRTDKKDGKVVQTLTRVVAQDSKTMTVTVKGTNAQGQAVNNVIVFDKQ